MASLNESDMVECKGCGRSMMSEHGLKIHKCNPEAKEANEQRERETIAVRDCRAKKDKIDIKILGKSAEKSTNERMMFDEALVKYFPELYSKASLDEKYKADMAEANKPARKYTKKSK